MVDLKRKHPQNKHSADQHERSDWHLKPILIALAGLAALMIIALVGSGAIIRFLSKDSAPPKEIRLNQKPAFRGPELQANPKADLDNFRKKENHELTTYRWIDKTNGIAHIPIDRAIELIAAEGLPYRSQRVKNNDLE